MKRRKEKHENIIKNWTISWFKLMNQKIKEAMHSGKLNHDHMKFIVE